MLGLAPPSGHNVYFTMFLHPRRGQANLCLALKWNVIAYVADTPL